MDFDTNIKKADEKLQTMNKNCLPKIFISLLGVIMACMPAISQEFKKPNIIFILADDLGYGDVSAMNANSKIKTTNIDRLVSQGVSFTDAHSSSAVCTPTRYGILTGRYNWRSTLKSGVLMGYSKALIPEERKTMAAFLKEKNIRQLASENGTWDGRGIT